MAKGNNISVIGADYYRDYIPTEKPENLIGNSVNNAARVVYANSQRNSTYLLVSNDQTSQFINKGDGNGRYVTKTITYAPVAGSGYETIDLPTPDGSIFGGMWIRTESNQFKIQNFDPAKSYAFSMKVKNAGSTEGVRVGLSMTNYGTASESYTKEYGTEGMLLTSEYQEFNATIKPGTGYNPSAASHNLMVGAPIGTKANSVIHIDLTDDEAVYFAEEVAYDISVSVDEATVSAGGSVNATATVENQVGVAGYLDQDVEWYVMNTERNQFVEGFTVTETANGVTVTVGDAVEIGTYDIVAVSDKYSMAKGARIEVTEVAEAVTEFELIQDQGAVMFVAKVENSAANAIRFVLVSYIGTVMDKVLYNNDVEVVDGVAELEFIPDDVFENGTVVKGFIWDSLSGMNAIDNLTGKSNSITINTAE